MASYSPMMTVPLGKEEQEEASGLPWEAAALPVVQSRTTMDEAYGVRLAGAKLTRILVNKERGDLDVEKDSVYGGALAIPQIARSCGWPIEMVCLCLRTYMLLVLNVALQLYVIFFINKEELVMDKFAGEMYMCNLGANLEQCPDGKGCIGPAGTRYTPSRLYDFGSWSTRTFVRDSLLLLFPNKSEEIRASVDPGEYGVENSECRLVCCFLFIISLMGELYGIVELAGLLFYVPTKAESWVRYELPEWAAKRQMKAVHNWSELDFVKIQVSGIPWQWKLFSAVTVLLPKAVIWVLLLRAGNTFLMETSGIDNIIVNTTALGFILSIDEMLFMTLSTDMTNYMLATLEAFPLYDLAQEEGLGDDEVIRRHHEDRAREPLLKIYRFAVPKALCVVGLLWLIAMADYYYSNCEKSADGTWVSRSMFLPTSVKLPFLKGLFPELLELEEEAVPYWTMPQAHEV